MSAPAQEESGWRWCSRCQALVRNEPARAPCAGGGWHDRGEHGGDFVLPWTPAEPTRDGGADPSGTADPGGELTPAVDGLIAHWPLTGTLTHATAPWPVTVVGTVEPPGPAAPGTRFTRGGLRADVTTVPTDSRDLTVTWWMRVDQPPPPIATIIDHRVDATSTNAAGFVAFLYRGRLGVQLSSGAEARKPGEHYFNVIDSEPVATDSQRWVPAAVTVTTATDESVTVRMRIGDRIREQTASTLAGPRWIAGHALHIGRGVAGTAPYSGMLGDLAVFDRALSDDEVGSILDAGSWRTSASAAPPSGWAPCTACACLGRADADEAEPMECAATGGRHAWGDRRYHLADASSRVSADHPGWAACSSCRLLFYTPLAGLSECVARPGTDGKPGPHVAVGRYFQLRTEVAADVARPLQDALAEAQVGRAKDGKAVIQYLNSPGRPENANVGPRIDFGREEDLLWMACEDGDYGRQFRIEPPREVARQVDIEKRLEATNPTILHISCHGLNGAGLELEVDTLTGERLGAIVGSHQTRARRERSGEIHCVVLNSCYSIALDEERRGVRHLLDHVDCVVAVEREIEDLAALLFTACFYDRLTNGATVAEAVDYATERLGHFGYEPERSPRLVSERELAETKRFARIAAVPG